MKPLVFFGAAYFDYIKLIDAINRHEPTWNLLGFIDDTPELQGKTFLGYTVLGTRDRIPELNREGVYFVNNVHGPRNKQAVAEMLLNRGCRIAGLIHPGIDMNYVTTGIGCVIPDGCVIGSNVAIGNFVTLRLRVLLSHDVTVEDYVFVGPGATIGGETVLRQGAFIGAGATVMLRREVGAGAVVGAGSVVTRNVMPHVTVAGVPAREMSLKGGETS
ncbi:MAG: epsM 1 [Firmicutes bacterium]|nr:epsM 1 [Bacillota bacterium]